jgi:hypothetical protein
MRPSLMSLQLRSRQSKDMDVPVQVKISSLQPVVHAFPAQTVVPMNASLAILIFCTYSLGASFETDALRCRHAF